MTFLISLGFIIYTFKTYYAVYYLMVIHNLGNILKRLQSLKNGIWTEMYLDAPLTQLYNLGKMDFNF